MDAEDVKQIVKDEMEDAVKLLSHIHLLLAGNGEPRKGMIVRMDRLEGSVKLMAWVGSVIITALAVAGASKLIGM